VNNTIRTIMVWLVIGVILTMVFMQVGNRQSSPTPDYSTFMEEAAGPITGEARQLAHAQGDHRDGKNYTVYTPGIQDPWMVGDR
jgi:hypothetical protein